MRGPFWNDKTGVTGEPNFRDSEPNYITAIDTEGKTVTLTGEAAEAYRASQKA